MRCFIGLPVEDERIINLAKNLLSGFRNDRNVKPVRPENLHVTVKFLGEISRVDEVKKILDHVNFIPKATVTGISAFPRPEFARVMYISLTGIENFISELDEKISRLGFPKEKSIVPHITVCRFRKPVKIAKTDIDRFDTEFKKIVLYRSVLTRNGPVYTELYTVRPGG